MENNLTIKKKITASLSGLTYKEAQRILLDLLEELKGKSVITASKK
jgi:hypothetical protein